MTNYKIIPVLTILVVLLLLPNLNLAKAYASSFDIFPGREEPIPNAAIVDMNISFANLTNASISREFVTEDEANSIIIAIEAILRGEASVLPLAEPLLEEEEEEALEELDDQQDEDNSGSGDDGGGDGGNDDTGDEDDEDVLPPPDDNSTNSNSTENLDSIVCIPEDRECTDQFLCPGEETVWDIQTQQCIPAESIENNNPPSKTMTVCWSNNSENTGVEVVDCPSHSTTTTISEEEAR